MRKDSSLHIVSLRMTVNYDILERGESRLCLDSPLSPVRTPETPVIPNEERNLL
jgi:hypothetical protein